MRCRFEEEEEKRGSAAQGSAAGDTVKMNVQCTESLEQQGRVLRAFLVPTGLRQHTVLSFSPPFPPSNRSEFRNTFQTDTSIIYVRYSTLGCTFILDAGSALALCSNLYGEPGLCADISQCCSSPGGTCTKKPCRVW